MANVDAGTLVFENPLAALAAFDAGLFSRARGVDFPRLDQYFGPWLILENWFRPAVQRVNAIDLRLHVAEHREPQAAADGAGSSRGYQMARGGIALISLSGALMKAESSMGDSCSTVMVRRAIRMAAADDDVSGICLRIDSPGGTVSGTADLAADVAAAAARKPVYAYCEDMCASAAYWVASQCTRCFANATAIVGSIGTYMVIEDSSKAAATEGVKVHVIRAGDLKGGATPGTEVSEEFLEAWQTIVDSTNEHFLRGVASGRKMSLAAVRELADGRVYLAQDAAQNGLIDGVKSLDEVMSMFPNPKRSKSKMANDAAPAGAAENVKVTGAEPLSASYQDLVAGCPGADEKFICSQLAAKASLDQARQAWMTEQNNRLTAANKAKDEAEQKANAKRSGVASLSQGKPAGDESSAGDVVAEWDEARDKEVERLKKNPTKAKLPDHQLRAQAIANVVARDPDLHDRFRAAAPQVYRNNVHANLKRQADAVGRKYGG